ncbi:NUDIX hydrolase [Silvibacterium sp.]|uniref:NUDIX hydrolase n=1 Tax=Silvibacterium sp. TaxID=1964179 RepID=UPI0039E39160
MSREYPQAPIVGVGAVVLDGDRVLLIRRAKEPMKGQWSLPGGALEVGETLAQGAQREAREETGLEVEPLVVVEVLDRISHDAAGQVQYHYVLVDFLCRVTGGELKPGSDAAEVRWAARGALQGVASFTVEVIEKAFRLRNSLEGQ